MKKQKSQIFYLICYSLTLIGAIAQFANYIYAPYIFAIGAILIILIQFKVALEFRDSKSMRVQRLVRISFLSSLLLAIATYLMFTNSNLWVIAVLIYGLVTLFISFRGE